MGALALANTSSMESRSASLAPPRSLVVDLTFSLGLLMLPCPHPTKALSPPPRQYHFSIFEKCYIAIFSEFLGDFCCMSCICVPTYFA